MVMYDKLYLMTVSAGADCEEPFSGFIDGLDCEGWCLEQNPESDNCFYKIFFTDKPSESILSKKVQDFLAELEEYGIDIGSRKVEFSELDREDWQNSWRDNFRVFSIDDRLFIKPKWAEPLDLFSDQIVIQTDPGIVFGSGEHPTTNFCLKLLVEQCGKYESFLDIGCGSGILCVAAAKLGANRVFGFDNDRVSVVHAKDMSVANGVGDKVEADCLDLDSFIPKEKFDLVAVNLFAEVIIKYKEKIDDSLNPNGLLILTGILNDRSETIKREFCSTGYKIESFFEETEWSGFLFRREPIF